MFDVQGTDVPQKQNIINTLVDSPDMSMTNDFEKELPPTLLSTNFNLAAKASDSADNLSIFVSNIVHYCKMVEQQKIDNEGATQLRQILKAQLNELWFEDKPKRFADEFKIEIEEDVQPFQKKLYELEQIIRAVGEQKNSASSETKYVNYETEVNKYIQHLEQILDADNIKQAIDDYELYELSAMNQADQDNKPSEILIPPSHHFKELLNCNIHYGPEVFNYIRPDNHQFYISQAAKTYHPVAPFKLKNITLSISEGPVINRPNYFEKDLDEGKTILGYCLPGTNKFVYYSLADVCKVHTVAKEYYQERQLSNQWTFSKATKSVITPNGKIYAVNCRTTKDKIDPYLYEITQTKASNRGPIPVARRDSSIIFLNGSIYIIGGQADGQKCSRKNYRYSIKQKKWYTLAESNVALRKATICTVSNRYICKLGGLNEFDYINKVIEMYDSLTDKWSLVRASPRNIMEEVQILENSYAIQISDDEVYIFGGKNSNGFNTDTGFILMISEIKERRKGAAKVSGQFWNVSIGKRNILTAFGQFYASSVVIQHNCIYGLRTEVTQALAP